MDQCAQQFERMEVVYAAVGGRGGPPAHSGYHSQIASSPEETTAVLHSVLWQLAVLHSAEWHSVLWQCCGWWCCGWCCGSWLVLPQLAVL
jgi:hypothetical protein